ncbi:MAG TPA: dihydropteroate synthase [Methylomirabilota bacterium]|nr:dihydropteroate synthase [Methylomirabilota bacterium]
MTSNVADLAGVGVGAGWPVVVMGAVNVSPESFYAGSVRRDAAALLDAARKMVDAGAAVIDVGARSTAPYLAAAITDDEETARLSRAVEALAAELPVPVSADTASVRGARAAMDAGAQIVNDVTGLRDPAMAALVHARARGVILMASPDGVRGASPSATPRSTRGRASEGARTADPVERVRALLRQALERAQAAGIADRRIVVDPGIGFFRDEGLSWDEWDVRVLAGLERLQSLGRPLGVAVSRKSFVGAITGRARPEDRLAGSLGAAAVAVVHGAALVRAHDVAQTVDAVRVAERLRPARRRC